MWKGWGLYRVGWLVFGVFFILFHFILSYFISFYFIIYSVLFFYYLFYFILFYVNLFCFQILLSLSPGSGARLESHFARE